MRFYLTQENIRYHLKKLTDDGIICRFEAGTYYMPKINLLGEKTTLYDTEVKYVST